MIIPTKKNDNVKTSSIHLLLREWLHQTQPTVVRLYNNTQGNFFYFVLNLYLHDVISSYKVSRVEGHHWLRQTFFLHKLPIKRLHISLCSITIGQFFPVLPKLSEAKCFLDCVVSRDISMVTEYAILTS